MTTLVETPIATQTSRSKHIGLWIVQVLLALFFLMVGTMKLTSTPEMMVKQGMAWAASAPPALIKFIGVMETLGAIGLVGPAATKIMPKLTAWAALGLATVVTLGGIMHAIRGEWMPISINVIVAGLGVFVFAGRK